MKIPYTDKHPQHHGFLFIALALVACLGPHAVDAATPTAEYSVEFNATWSASTHPDRFPGSAHFSGLIGGTHSDRVVFWEPGEPASAGIKTMAETGGKSPLITEISTAIAADTAEFILNGGGIGTSPGSVRIASFTIGIEFPLITLVSMIAPSPDWFVGVHDLPLLVDGRWVEELVVELPPYDAGTDSGATYTSSNQATTPAEPISVIETAPFLAGDAVPPLGTFTFTRLDEEPSSVEYWELY